MNLAQNLKLLDHLAASHALGTLRGGARRRFEALAREQAPVRAAALVWQARLSGLTELQEPVSPNPAVWIRIDNLVRAQEERSTIAATKSQGLRHQANEHTDKWWGRLSTWRRLSAASALASVVAVASVFFTMSQWRTDVLALHAQLRTASDVKYVAVMADDKAAASILVTFDRKGGQLTLQRLSGFQEGADQSLQLWALPNSGGPRSLGVLSNERLLQLAATESDVKDIPVLAVSVEPKGGVPSATGPTGPVVFKGQWISKLM